MITIILSGWQIKDRPPDRLHIKARPVYKNDLFRERRLAGLANAAPIYISIVRRAIAFITVATPLLMIYIRAGIQFICGAGRMR